MKNLILTATVSLLSLTAFAQEAAIHSNTADIMAPHSVGAYAGQGAEQQIHSDVSAILAEAPKEEMGQAFDLQEGHYVLSEERGGHLWEGKSLFVERSTNNRNEFYALMIDNEMFYFDEGPRTATLYKGWPIKDGTVLQLTPVEKDRKLGLLVPASKESPTAPVLWISLKRTYNQKCFPNLSVDCYPYKVTGRNGGSHGVQMSMRGAWNNVHLVTNFNSDEFHWSDKKGGRGTADVSGNTFEILSPGSEEIAYTMFKLNGRNSAFFGLNSSGYNSQSETDLSQPEVEGIALFLKIPGVKQDVLLKLTPMDNVGEMPLEIFAPKDGPNWLERLLGTIFRTKGIVAPYGRY